MDKRFLVILAVIIIGFAGVFAINQRSDTQNNGSAKGTPTNHTVGEGQKAVTFTEYGDYQCPVCQVYSQPLKQVAAQAGKDIYFQFRHLPLTAIHPNAFAAARASEAASLQGKDKFWLMHDKLYDNQTEWSSVSSPKKLFDKYAKDIGLNLAKFSTDYGSGVVNDAINADLAAFDQTRQQKATPAFFLDGKYISNSELVDASGQPSAEKMMALINSAIAKKSVQ